MKKQYKLIALLTLTYHVVSYAQPNIEAPIDSLKNSTKTVLLFSSFVGRIRRFLMKKTQKDKKSGLFLSYVYTVYTYQKHGETLET